jgi:hypothetical protein
MTIYKAKVTLVGKGKILLHNGQTADPRNYFAKQMRQISAKRKKQMPTWTSLPKSNGLQACT